MNAAETPATLPPSDKPSNAELVKELESLAQAIADNAAATWWDGAVRNAHEKSVVCHTLRLAASRLSVPREGYVLVPVADMQPLLDMVNERMAQYTDSRQPTDFEVAAALVVQYMPAPLPKSPA